MTAIPDRAILPEPPEELKHLSGQLAARIRERIRERGPMPFGAYMEAALYEPGLGYYSAGLRKFGPGGDFVTAPELGELFGRCLARQLAEVCEPFDRCSILEVGAGSGRLAVQLLRELHRLCPDREVEYRILERSGHLRAVQRETLDAELPQHAGGVRWLDRPPQAPWQGVIVGNEVVDALPVERFTLAGGALQQLNVIATEAGFDWLPGPARTALQEAVDERLGEHVHALGEGYRSELCLGLDAWLAGLTANLERGCALLIDYGHPRREYYHPSRRRGTMICHYRHRVVEDPFRWPGLQDITAFVDFTALAEAGAACGLDCAGYASQAMFLLGCGLDEELADLPSRPAGEQLGLAAQARQLTLPSEMGEKFQAMALTRGRDAPLRGFALQDLRHRL